MACVCPVQVTLVAEERDRSISQIQELEAHITDLKHAAGETHSYPPCFAHQWFSEELSTKDKLTVFVLSMIIMKRFVLP